MAATSEAGRGGVAWALRWWAVVFFVAVCAVVTVVQPYDNGPPIRSDGLGYHAWTRAILDGRLTFCDYPELKRVDAATSVQPSTGRCADKYPPGLALLRFPVMWPFTALNGGELRSGAEDAVNQLLSIVAGALALVGVVAAARRAGVRDWVANCAAIAVAFGTGLFHYSTYDSSFTHAYSAAFVAGLVAFGVFRLLAAGDEPHDSTRRLVRDAVVVFVLAGFLVGIRLPSFLILAVLWLAAVFVVWRRGPRFRPRLVAITAGAAAATVVVGVSQVAYNRYVLGRWTISSYAGEHFSLERFHQLDVLASFQKGFVTWYPVVVVILLVAAWARNWAGIGLLVGLSVPLVMLYGAWDAWGLAGGFGHRGFVELAPVFGVVFAVSLERLGANARLVSLVVAGVAVTMTMGLLVGYWAGDIAFYGATNDQWVRYSVGASSFPIAVAHWIAGW